MIEDLWYKNAVIYALNVDSFMDGNGDGCGDFDGLTRQLEYLVSLGVDAVPFVIEGSPTASARKPPIHFEYLAQMRSFLEWRTSGAIMLGEANVLPPGHKKYFGMHGDGIHKMFNFYVNQYRFYALASGDARPLKRALLATRSLPPSAQWVNFLRNHDELDLGPLTDQQRAKVFERFGPEPSMQLYGRGIRRRLAPMLGARAHIELANSAMLSLPGTPVVRYGDEIGMSDDLRLKERDCARTPMQWSGEEHGGFTSAAQPARPVISTGPFGCGEVNVEKQRRDPDSLLNWTAIMIRVRKECAEIGWGEWMIVPTTAASILAICYQWRGNAVVVLHNFSSRPQEARFSIDAPDGGRLTNLLVNEELHAGKSGKSGKYRVVLESFWYRWYRVGGLGYALHVQRDSGAGVKW